ncbi:hypothetical protein BCR33DRAFT_717603 [Rhizoclosmatium globosum]|uniref:VOC domain-containing protein n=1 Tax=Rhizoclosmatium globosum TaxID=329046 RepID=A0A1Y2C934_9FUNG|nr:hypothetical protein BCR33DRAFT_717603 [Rhizoclosmatium globosum]|eukprot:ORY43374.1 hypothetical protein BCR33DRAFT_717603 [Rhizoclosmatium globosum]
MTNAANLLGTEYFLPTIDHEQTVAFYTTVLGFEVVMSSPEHTILIHPASTSKLHMVAPMDGYNPDREAPQIRLKVASLQTIKDKVEAGFGAWVHPSFIKNKGEFSITPWGTREYACQDPKSSVCLQFYEVIDD